MAMTPAMGTEREQAMWAVTERGMEEVRTSSRQPERVLKGSEAPEVLRLVVVAGRALPQLAQG
jgi:hypothetical protein